MKKILLTLFFTLLAVANWAYDVEVDGIYYNYKFTDSSVEVTHNGSYSNSYSGNVVIPETITLWGGTYSVTGIGDGAFDGCTGLTSITIPSSVTSIGDNAFNGCM